MPRGVLFWRPLLLNEKFTALSILIKQVLRSGQQRINRVGFGGQGGAKGNLNLNWFTLDLNLRL